MNRRLFVLTSMGAAPALAQTASSVGAGLIGTGNRGQYLLEGVLEQNAVRVTAVCDLKPDRLDRAATIAGRDRPATLRDWRELIERKDVDVVFIASPCDLHVEMAVAALRAGKHVYCEKPAGVTPESIGELVRVARGAKGVFEIGQQMRSMARVRQTIQRIHDGVAGKVIMVKAQRHASNDLAHDGSSADWFFDARRSGDVIVEMAVHNLDVCNWAIGSRPERAGGFGGTLLWTDQPPGRTNMDGYTLSYDYANGVKMSFTQVFFHPRGLPGGGQYTYVYGSKGAVDVNAATFHPREGSPVVLAEPMQESPHAHIAAFFESVRTGKRPVAGIDVAATAALTAILGREAIYRKRVVTWGDII